MPKITILDYGIGNILSVSRAFEHCGAEVSLTDSPMDVIKAEMLVLPGVGAFADGMNGLAAKSLIDPIKEFVKKDRPFMGICLGMQMMLDESEEFGLHYGLGLIHGRVKKIESTSSDSLKHKIPHIGWNRLVLPENRDKKWWDNTILSRIPEDSATYFVHSFTAVPDKAENRLADAYYGGRLISAVIREGNIYGCQFHPEKSGKIGLKIIENFLKLKHL